MFRVYVKKWKRIRVGHVYNMYRLVLLALLNLTEVGRLGKSSTMAVPCQRRTYDV